MLTPAAIRGLFGRWLDGAGVPPPVIDDVADFPLSHYSNKEIIRAGKVIGRRMPYIPTYAPELPEARELLEQYSLAFKIAYDFRDAHAYPMRRVRQGLAGLVRRTGVPGLTAARTKRMESIRKKLARLDTMTLTQIDDLGGCRAILDTVPNLNTVLDACRQANGPHKKRRDRSYIETPKLGGYRSHHLVYDFIASNTNEEPFEGRRIEVQLRTRLQHSWATAVESVGIVLDEDMKAGEGDPNWLRLFELVASEFAEAEGCAPVPGTEDRGLRWAEIKELESRVGARSFIRIWNLAIRQTTNYISPDARYFLIQFAPNEHTLGLQGYPFFEEASLAEQQPKGTVVVEVDKVENLREAYPNYFLDMTLFAQNLKRLVEGKTVYSSVQAEELTETQAKIRTVGPSDLGWLRDWQSWKSRRSK